MTAETTTPPDWELEYKRLSINVIYFIDEYWNKLHPDNPLILSNEEKQEIYDKHKIHIPLFNDFDQFRKYSEARRKLKESGLRDWEIDL